MQADERMLFDAVRAHRNLASVDTHTFRRAVSSLRKLLGTGGRETETSASRTKTLTNLTHLTSGEAAVFCVPTSHCVSELRVVLLHHCGYPGTVESLRYEAQTLLTRRKEGIRLCRLLNLCVSTGPLAYIALCEATQDILLHQNTAPAILRLHWQAICNVLAVRKYRANALCILKHLARDDPELLASLGSGPVPENQIQAFERLSSLHAEAMQELRQHEMNNRASAYPSRQCMSILRRFAGFGLFLERHVTQFKRTQAIDKTTQEHTQDHEHTHKSTHEHPQSRVTTPPRASLPPLFAFLKSATREELEDALLKFLSGIKPQNERVKSANNQHHAHIPLTFALRFLRGVPLARHIGCNCKDDLSYVSSRDLLRQLPNLRQPRDVNDRRTFTLEEVEAMQRAARNPAESLIIALLQQVGLRNSAIAHLRYDTLMDPTTGKPRDRGQVREKGNKIRHFILSPSLQSHVQLCADACLETCGGRRDTHGPYATHEQHAEETHETDTTQKQEPMYLLNLRKPTEPLSVNALGRILKRIAERAGIKGVKVHAHAFRNTLVTHLLLAGNSMEIVSKFLGHADTRTTSSFYFTPTPQALHQVIKNPFVPEETLTSVQKEE